MVDPKLLEILCCPETKQDVAPASADLVARLNQAIAAGSLKNKSGEVVKEKMEGGLLRADGQVLYPIRDDIPIMLIDESIVL
jgi:uncharacterized protein YbaR (Trm112 family)